MYEVYWCDLGSPVQCEGLERIPDEAAALEFARTRVLFSSLDSFAFVSRPDDAGTDRCLYRIYWHNLEVIHLERNSPNWNQPRVRP